MAQTDSVRYYMKVDTTQSGIRAGQDVSLRYICTVRSFPSLSWGEQIFAVFDKGTVWANSVNDLNKKSVACSFGYTKKNIRLLREAIEKQEEGISHERRQ